MPKGGIPRDSRKDHVLRLTPAQYLAVQEAVMFYQEELSNNSQFAEMRRTAATLERGWEEVQRAHEGERR